jgi:hypothetical protein
MTNRNLLRVSSSVDTVQAINGSETVVINKRQIILKCPVIDVDHRVGSPGRSSHRKSSPCVIIERPGDLSRRNTHRYQTKRSDKNTDRLDQYLACDDMIDERVTSCFGPKKGTLRSVNAAVRGNLSLVSYRYDAGVTVKNEL